MICHRCCAGKRANDGMPLATNPLLKTQNSAPGAELWTPRPMRGGALPRPSRVGPWQGEHSRANNFAPARRAFSLCAKGFLILFVAAGACCNGLPSLPQPTTRMKNASVVRNAFTAAPLDCERAPLPRGQIGRSRRRLRTAARISSSFR